MNSANNRIARHRTRQAVLQAKEDLEAQKIAAENRRAAYEIRRLALQLPPGCRETVALFNKAARSLEST